MYKQYEGFYSGYMYLIEFVDRNFNTLKHRHNHHFVNYLVHSGNSSLFDIKALAKITDYTVYLLKISKDNDYSGLLKFVKNNTYLLEIFNTLQIDGLYKKKETLENSIKEYLKQFPNDTVKKQWLEQLKNINVEYVRIIDTATLNEKPNYEIIEIGNEEQLLEELFSHNFSTFNRTLFKNLLHSNSLKIEKEKEKEKKLLIKKLKQNKKWKWRCNNEYKW